MERAIRGGEWWLDPKGTDLVTLAKNAGNWDEDAFRAAVADYVPAPQSERVLALVDRVLANPHRSGVYWGGGQYPSSNISFAFPGSTNDYGAVILSIYTSPTRTVLAINFHWMAWGGIGFEDMERVASAVRVLPGVEPLYADLAESDYHRRPSLPVAEVFADESAGEVIATAIESLLERLWSGEATARDGDGAGAA